MSHATWPAYEHMCACFERCVRTLVRGAIHESAMQSMCTQQSVLKHRQDAHLLVYEGAQRQMPHAPCSTTGTCIYLLTSRIASWSAADAKVACTGVRSMKWPAYLVRCSRGYVLALRTAPRSGALILSRPSRYATPPTHCPCELMSPPLKK